MYFPQFLVGMVVTVCVIGAWTYEATGSVRIAVAWTALTAVLLQVGYFALFVRLVFRRNPAADAKARTNPQTTAMQSSPEGSEPKIEQMATTVKEL
ncbi:exopolysaccharide production repressor protein [Mesorhizobium helmanticense]|uniref:Exopolysaccharide production repressor exox n=1 Tax=Mesorhizobium helmanticense TaxID=1776423 RepID=A0A2T4IMG4_9HYPH|nr:exopolysaccharide production repressor protein [Mesorhizobium helmanticense]PTE06783.1 hypothetical protein C9427_30325 [Mesorhizobium helmanticense]